METSLERIKNDIENLSKFNSTPEKGCTRFSYTREDQEAKEYLIQMMKKLGLKIIVDGIGNVSGRLEGKDSNLPAIMIGSHLDTVLHGGKYDGVVGIVAGLEIIRVIIENNVALNHPVQLMVFAEEEGSNFGVPTAGSKVLTGQLKLEEIKRLKNDRGESYYDVLKSNGLDTDSIPKGIINPKSIKAMLELHIEQSVLLERSQLSIGIVKGVAGIRAYSIELVGLSNHAGATPMNLRTDPMVAAGQIISAIPAIVKENGLSSSVATVGRIECVPNIFNVIPHSVKFTVDIRDVDNRAMDNISEAVKAYVNKVSANNNLTFKIEKIAVSSGVLLSDKITDLIEEVVKEKNIPYCRMNSGAVHDAAIIASITDVGMIFIPSKDGRSHVPEEYTPYENIKEGCDVLLEAALRIDKL